MDIVVPLCIDCAFYRKGIEGQLCARPIDSVISPVEGEVLIELNGSAHRERAKETRGLFRRRLACGPAGVFFEPR